MDSQPRNGAGGGCVFGDRGPLVLGVTAGSTSVLDATKLQHLGQAVSVDDWILAADVCLEIALEARTPLEQSLAEELANAVRLRRAEFILNRIEGLEIQAR